MAQFKSEIKVCVVKRGTAGDGFLTKGGWRGGLGSWAFGARTASLACPDCKEVFSLTDHKINDDGAVSPSVVCPREGCSFHEFIILEGWKL